MPDITAVWCLRGGYGCGQLLPGLDWGAPAGGLSATTDRFLRHLGVAQRFPPPRPACDPRPGGHRTRSVAAERPASSRERLASLASVSRLLAGIDHELPVQHLGGHKQRVEGALIGGNLTALACMAGTLGSLHAPAGRSWSWRTSANPTTAWSAASGNCSTSTRASSARSAWAVHRLPAQGSRPQPGGIFGEIRRHRGAALSTTCPAGMVREPSLALTEDPRCSRETGCAGRGRGALLRKRERAEVPLERHNPSGIRPRRAAAQPQRQADPRF